MNQQKNTMKKQDIVFLYIFLIYNLQTMKTEKVTRVEIIDDEGRQYVNTNTSNVKLSLQDEERTLKIFINNRES
jgi:hypothetical protein